MVAASRRPRFRSLRAGAAERHGAASPTSATRLAARCCGSSNDSRKCRSGRARPCICRGSSATAVRWPRRAPSSLSASSRSASWAADDPHDVGAIAARRHQRAWSGRGVEFGRHVAMRPRVRDVEGKGHLRQARWSPQCRPPRAEGEWRPSALTAISCASMIEPAPVTNGALSSGPTSDIGGLVIDTQQGWKLGGALLPSPRPARDCRGCSRTPQGRSRPPRKRTSGARNRRSVSSTSRITLSGVASAATRSQHAEPAQHLDGGLEERRGAVVLHRRRVAPPVQRAGRTLQRRARQQIPPVRRHRWPPAPGQVTDGCLR